MEDMIESGPQRGTAWERAECQALIAELQGLRRSMLDCEERLAPWSAGTAPAQTAGARSLAH